MTAIKDIRNRLIDKIFATENEELLEAIEKIISSTQHENNFPLSSTEIEFQYWNDRNKNTSYSKKRIDFLKRN